MTHKHYVHSFLKTKRTVIDATPSEISKHEQVTIKIGHCIHIILYYTMRINILLEIPELVGLLDMAT